MVTHFQADDASGTFAAVSHTFLLYIPNQSYDGPSKQRFQPIQLGTSTEQGRYVFSFII